MTNEAQRSEESDSTDLLCDEKPIKVIVTAKFEFEIKAKDYLTAFREAVDSIEVNHDGYKGSRYH